MDASLMGRARRRLIMPDRSEVTWAKRGFPPTDPARQANLEKVGNKFLDGFSYGIAGRTIGDIESALEEVESPFRGFAYEGCAMALAVRDGLFSFRPWVRDFLEGRGADHIYMVYIGVGWAMARLPKIRWRAVFPDDPLLCWLAFDGYGFHQAYFSTEKYVTQHYQAPIRLVQPEDYANNAIDQGIGRALWFICGSDPRAVAAAIDGFPSPRRADLWSGAALASVYAGGADPGELAEMARLSGEHRAHAAQGAAFAAKARVRAGLVTLATEIGVETYCGMSAEHAAAVTDDALSGLSEADGSVPQFELWRARIRKRFEFHGTSANSNQEGARERDAS